MRALALAGCVLLSAPALACINGMNEERQAPTMDLVARSAARKLLDKDYAGAQADAERVLASDAQSGLKRQARRTLGTAKLRSGDLEGARTVFTRALEETPDEPALLARLGEAEAGLGKNADAKKHLEPLREKGLLPDPEAHLALAKAYLALGDWASARAEVDAALKQEPSNLAALEMKKLIAPNKGAGSPTGKKPNS